METLAIIPARGGSKGLPRKNVLPLCGRPLIAWTIDAARRAQTIERVVVSTDDAEISSVSRAFGAEVVERPAELSQDTSSSEAALLHALSVLKEREHYVPKAVAFLQCTSPLTLSADIDGTVNALTAHGADTAFAAVPFHYFLWRIDAGGWGVGINHDSSRRQLRQEREPQYLEAGAVYAMRTEGFVEHRHRFFGKTVVYEMPAERRLEIDEPADFEVAETLLRERLRADVAACLPERLAGVVFDFDGVFTDNRVWVGESGEEIAACNRADGWGIAQLKRLGVPILVLSTEVNPIVAARCRKLGVDCEHGHEKKGTVLARWIEEHKLDARGIVYVGNDENDVECLRLAGCPVVVGDAHRVAKREATIVLETGGGHGAVRELTDILCNRFGRRS